MTSQLHNKIMSYKYLCTVTTNHILSIVTMTTEHEDTPEV